MTGDPDTLQAGYVPLAPSRDDLAGPAVAGGAAGAGAVRQAQHLGHGDRSSRCPTRSARSSTGWCSQSGWTVTERQRPRDAGAGAAAPRLPAVPALRELRHRRDARVRGRARGARRQAPARRRPGVPRPRGNRDAARRAGRHRVAGRPAVGLCDAAGRAVRDRRRGAARVPPSLRRRRSIRSASRRTLPDAPASRLRAALRRAGGAAPPAKPASGGRHDRRAVRVRRARTSGSRCGAAASRCSPTCCTWPSWRGSTSCRAACRSAASSTRCRQAAERRARPPKRRLSRRAATASA